MAKTMQVSESSPVATSKARSVRIGRPSWLAQIESVVERGGLPLLLLAVIIFFSSYGKTSAIFPSAANVQNILANQSVTGLIALGMVIPLVAGFFDLSVAASAGLSSVTVASLVAKHDQPIAIAILGGLLIAMFAGLVNGVLVGILQLNPFITTFGTYIVISGILQWYTKGQTILDGVPPATALWASGKWLGAPRVFWALILAAVLVWYLLRQTPFGRHLAAIGSNEAAARLAGIRVDKAVFLSFLLSGLLAGMAGVMLTVRMGTADSGTAIAYLFPALAAVFLGQTSINPGQYNVWGTIFGVFLVATAVSGFTLLGADAWIQQLFNGLALLLSLVMTTLTARARDKRARATAV